MSIEVRHRLAKIIEYHEDLLQMRSECNDSTIRFFLASACEEMRLLRKVTTRRVKEMNEAEKRKIRRVS